MDAFEIKLCQTNDLENNSMKEIEINLDGQSYKVLVVKTENKFHCLPTSCTHYKAPLSKGVLYKGRIRCFAHGATFNVETGDIEDYPGPDCLPKYKLNLKGDDVCISVTKKELEITKKLREAQEHHRENETCRPFSSNLVAYDKINKNITKITSKCLIIGSGAAGIVCMDTLREAGYGSNITMITKVNTRVNFSFLKNKCGLF